MGKQKRGCVHCSGIAKFEKKKTVTRLTINGPSIEKVDIFRCSCGKPTWTF